MEEEPHQMTFRPATTSHITQLTPHQTPTQNPMANYTKHARDMLKNQEAQKRQLSISPEMDTDKRAEDINQEKKLRREALNLEGSYTLADQASQNNSEAEDKEKDPVKTLCNIRKQLGSIPLKINKNKVKDIIITDSPTKQLTVPQLLQVIQNTTLGNNPEWVEQITHDAIFLHEQGWNEAYIQTKFDISNTGTQGTEVPELAAETTDF